MGIPTLKPFLIKKGIGDTLNLTQLATHLAGQDVVVDVSACFYFMLLRIMKLPKRLQTAKLEEKLVSYFVRHLGLEANNIQFVFDGRLHEAKWATKTARIESAVLKQKQWVNK
jgi:hypothetical protein